MTEVGNLERVHYKHGCIVEEVRDKVVTGAKKKFKEESVNMGEGKICYKNRIILPTSSYVSRTWPYVNFCSHCQLQNYSLKLV